MATATVDMAAADPSPIRYPGAPFGVCGSQAAAAYPAGACLASGARLRAGREWNPVDTIKWQISRDLEGN